MENMYNFGYIGNMHTNALVDSSGKILWWCFPSPDAQAVCCALLDNSSQAEAGFIGVGFEHVRKADQFYEKNSAVLVTRLSDNAHNVIEIVDFAPCYIHEDRLYTPPQLIRIIRRIAGRPRISLQVRPSAENGNARAKTILGANHVSYCTPSQSIRITTDASISDMLEESLFYLENSITLIMGVDESPTGNPKTLGQQALEATNRYWRTWVHNISIPFQWQSAVIRAAITIRLNTFVDTGAILAAPTTSLPDDIKNPHFIDYRYSWLRDCEQVINALNTIGATGTMERYLHYIQNIIADAQRTLLQPVYGINRKTDLSAQQIQALSGYNGHSPVIMGNDSCHDTRYDVYGCVLSACSQAFFDQRLYVPASMELFEQLQWLAQAAFDSHDQPDTDVWHRDNCFGIHTLSSVMCWVACDRLSAIADSLNLSDQAQQWQSHAQTIKDHVLLHAWNENKQTLTSLWDGEQIDASLLLIGRTGFFSAKDPIWQKTCERIEKCLLRNDYIMRYEGEDDDQPVTSMPLNCTFWWIQALHLQGHSQRAREHFEKILALRNPLGLLASHVLVQNHSMCGNFPQTSSMVGLLSCAVMLSKSWQQQFCR